MGIFTDMLDRISDSSDDLAIATAALSIYTAASDGTITLDEFLEVGLSVGAINTKQKISDGARQKIKEISKNHSITWDEVKGYLDKVSKKSLLEMENGIKEIILASDGTDEAERKVINDFNAYVEGR